MPLHVALNHRTSYAYERPILLGPQVIRLRPAPQARTPILAYSLKIEPASHYLNWVQDPQGNYLARVVFPERVQRFTVTVDLIADMATINPFDFFLEPDAERWQPGTRFPYDPTLAEELAPFRKPVAAGPRLDALLAELPRQEQRTVEFLVALNTLVHRRVDYVVRMEPGVYAPEETLERGRGSCRDSAWLMVAALRQLGFAARFVSGYLIQLTADVAPLQGPAGPTRDFTDLHAWAEVYLPGAGWVGLDATSALFCGEGHIPLAASPDPASAAPISGLVEPAETDFAFAMEVQRVRETPRVTKPYEDAVWQAIKAQGEAVDRALQRGDVRLTMGGEPTFIAADDMDAPEWTTAALGPTKRVYAERLLQRLAGSWAPGAALHYTIGKQYPGEQLPRWALHAHWRTDGEPVWRDPALLAPPGASGTATGAATADHARRFATALAARLRLDPGRVLDAYEDLHYYLWREKRLPRNVGVEDAKLQDPLERARLARVFGQGLQSPVGSVLPLRRAPGDAASPWQSGPWPLRDERLCLIPGDSPIGLRLPLDSLPWQSAEAQRDRAEQPVDPFAPRAPLPPRTAFGQPAAGPSPPGRPQLIGAWRALPAGGPGAIGDAAAAQGDAWADDSDVVRTALAVEAREGRLHVFYPPLYALEAWLDLTAAIEDTAAALGQPVVLEGYMPPRDPRLQHFSVTPDPGVIEVNIHPSTGWAEHLARTEELYEAARQTGLSAEKFMLDGRHVGTGGGNHVVMGGATPADSPFLRRPDLLKSLLGFWHNHPSLSFLFSGLFIGPTSQHPRVDEARQDAIAELELAFSRIAPGQETPPWLVDRLFRHLLADMTGNTHRTEFCIDKLYAPEHATGRLGLVEYRALEMPPHAQMSMVQMLLMRSAVAAFWERPYERRLVRWGTRLHDEFMLPHFVAQDFGDALQELAGLGFPLAAEWFRPHREFRFPLLGETSLRGATLELRQALEPWHVLGEEPAAGGTARYVDSSTERLEVKLKGWVAERFAIVCDGIELPLHPTESPGEYVGAVRFKAWNPPSALHPTVAARPAVVFDVYDRWNGRSIGGMTHHVTHPGGLGYERLPVNANEAEARRRARFQPFGHTPGPMPEPRRIAGVESPRTLDLRRVP